MDITLKRTVIVCTFILACCFFRYFEDTCLGWFVMSAGLLVLVALMDYVLLSMDISVLSRLAGKSKM